MICGKACFADEKDPEEGKDVNRAEYKEYRDVVLDQCKERGDEEARVIKHRVKSYSDFIAAETRFYNICLNLFNLKVKTKTMAPGMKGRPSKDSDEFETSCVWIETEGELYTLDELRTQLQSITESKDHKKILFAKYSQQDRVDHNSSAKVYRNRH